MSVCLPLPSSFHVDPLKITGYLLNLSHPVGGPKAAFFCGWGFDRSRPDEFEESLFAKVGLAGVPVSTASLWGTRLAFIGRMPAPNGLTPLVLSIWQMDTGSTVAKLLTAYPA